jgi:hypothetical protein
MHGYEEIEEDHVYILVHTICKRSLHYLVGLALWSE